MSFIILFSKVDAQIKIGDNPTTINANSVLEMESTNKGMLLPRLALSATTNVSPLSAHVAGMVVYNTATAGDVLPGYYYNDGAKWIRIVGLADGKNLSAGSLLQMTGTPTGASLKDAGYRVDTSALKTFITNTIKSDSISGKNLSAGTLLQTTGTPTGASLKDAGYQVDTAALKTFLNSKIQISTTAPITGNGTAANPIGISGSNTSAGTFIIVTGGTGAALVANTIALDTTALKAFINNKTTNSLNSVGNIMTSIVNGVSANDTIITSHNVSFSGNVLTSTTNGVSSSTTLSNNDSTTASNGLNLSGKDIRLGGALTAATTVTTSATNTIKFAGLQNGTTKDSILVQDSATGVMKKIAATSLLAGATTHTFNTAGNIATSVVNGVSANDTIITNNTLTGANNKLTSTVNGVVADLTPAPGAITNKFLGFDAAGNLVTDTANTLTTNTLSNPTNTITSTVNGVVATAPAVNTVSNTFTPATRSLTTTVNGIAGTAVTITDGPDSTTASNGLTLSGKDVKLGGALTGATTLTTSATNTLALKGLQDGVKADSILVLDSATGALKKRSTTSLISGSTTNVMTSSGNIMTSVVNGVSTNDTIITSNVITLTADTLTTSVNGVVSNKVGINSIEPWRSTVTNVGAKSNTDSVYIMGKVGINTATPNSYLSVNGSMSTAARKVTAATTVTADDYTVLANCTSAAYTVTLPSAASCNGRIYKVGKSDVTGNVLTFSESIFLAETVSFTTLNYNRMFTIQSIGGQWWVVNQQ